MTTRKRTPGPGGGPAFPRRQHNQIISEHASALDVPGHSGHPGMTLAKW